MDKQRLTTLITQPERLQEKDFRELSNLNQEYPYFQAISPLLTLGSKQYAPQTEKKKLQTAAIYALDRKHLKEILSKDYSATEQKAKEALQQDQTEKEFKNKVVADPTGQIEKKAAPKSAAKIDSTPAQSSTHLPDSFFDELFKDMEALKAEKEKYQETLKKFESEKPASKPKASKTSKKTISKKTSASSSSSAKTRTTKKATPKTQSAKTTKGSSTKKATATKAKTASKKSSTSKSNKSAKVASKKPKKDEHDIIEEITSRKELKISDAHKKEQLNIINNFIEKEPILTRRIDPDNQSNKQEAEDLSANSTNLSDDVVSETLAKLMIKQGRKQKAIDIYKKLIWKFPQKKTYFVEIIDELKKES